MKFADHLSSKDKQKLRKASRNKKEHKSKNEEKVNWIDIMGMNRDRYGRGKGGAMRRR